MYIETISKFLKDIALLKESFNQWCGEDINDIIKSGEQTTTIKEMIDAMNKQSKKTKDYLKCLVKSKNDDVKENDSFKIENVQNTIIWRLIRDTYKKKDEEIAKDINNIKEEKSREIASWIFSLPALADVLGKACDNEKDSFYSVQIALEAKFFAGGRVDAVLVGEKRDKSIAAVLIENKRWSLLEKYECYGEEEVKNPLYKLKNQKKYLEHPCKQVERYKDYLENVNGYIQDYKKKLYSFNIKLLYSLVYMQNATEQAYNDRKGIFDKKFDKIIDSNPVFIGKNGIFIKNQSQNLLDYIKNEIGLIKGVDGLAEKIYLKSEAKFSENYLAILKKGLNNRNNLIKVLKTIIDEDNQKPIIDTIKGKIDDARDMRIGKNADLKNINRNKTVYVIEGGPGTGKSFMGLALLSYYYKEGKDSNNAQVKYMLKNYTQRWVLEKNGIPTDAAIIDSVSSIKDNSCIDCIICDESHRLWEKDSDDIEQIKSIIQQSPVSVFFYDKKQKVSVKDYFDIDELNKIVDTIKNEKKIKIEVIPETLNVQYRMKMPDVNNYLNFIDNLLYNTLPSIKPYQGDYEVAIADSTSTLFSRIYSKNSIRGKNANTSRVVAGRGRDTNSTNVGWRYNLGPFRDEENTTYKWHKKRLPKPETFVTDEQQVKNVGSINVCQGIDFEYVGVIIAPELNKNENKIEVNFKGHWYEDGNIVFDNRPTKNKTWEKKFDEAINHKGKDKIEEIIKNTYTTLLTRGEKGCYIYCCEKDLQDYLAKIFPIMKTGEVKQNKNGYYIECVNAEKYLISNQTIQEIEMKKKRKIKYADKILVNKQNVTFLVDSNNKEYAVSLEPIITS